MQQPEQKIRFTSPEAVRLTEFQAVEFTVPELVEALTQPMKGSEGLQVVTAELHKHLEFLRQVTQQLQALIDAAPSIANPAEYQLKTKAVREIPAQLQELFVQNQMLVAACRQAFQIIKENNIPVGGLAAKARFPEDQKTFLALSFQVAAEMAHSRSTMVVELKAAMQKRLDELYNR